MQVKGEKSKQGRNIYIIDRRRSIKLSVNQSPLNALWKNWKENQDADAANQLIEKYMYLVHFHSERISTHLPSNVDKDDIKSLGMLGLYDAMKKFEPERELKFETYASFRIRGAIMDGLRKEDWLPRSIREKTKKVEQAQARLEQVMQREATAQEIAKETGMTVQEVEETIQNSLFANVLSIEEERKESEQEGGGYSIEDESSPLPEQKLLEKEIKKELIQGIKSLNEKEQTVISLFYNEELTLTEIGYVLNLSTSRISQIHKRAIFKLRKTLGKLQYQS